MGEVACLEEIKAFTVEHNIKQQQIASLAGSCLPSWCHTSCLATDVTHLLLLVSVYLCYLAYCNNPEAIGNKTAASNAHFHKCTKVVQCPSSQSLLFSGFFWIVV